MEVRPYVSCLNSTIGTPEQIRSSCGEVRAIAVGGHNAKIDKAKLDRAIQWLDGMIEERAACETRLSVED